MKRKILTLLIVLIGIIAIIYFFYLSKNQTPPAPTIAVTQGTIVEKITAVGSIMPRTTISVKSPISGTVETLFSHEGEYVQRGQKLLQVKPQPTPDEYAQAKQQVEIDLTNEKKAKQDLDRYEYLVKTQIIAANDQNYNIAQTTYRAAKLQSDLDKQRLDLLERGRAEIGGRVIANTIESPISGYILLRLVNQGDPVVAQTQAQSGSVLFTIADMNDLYFVGQVSQLDAAKVQEGMPATLKVAALPDVTVLGKLTKLALQSVQLGAQANDQSTNVGVNVTTNAKSDSSPFNVGFKVEIGNLSVPQNIKLRAGYSANADIIVRTLKDVLLLPQRVLQFDNDKAFVWLPGVDNDEPQKRYIETGVSDGVNVQILRGLRLGELVLENPPSSEEVVSKIDKHNNKKPSVRVRVR